MTEWNSSDNAFLSSEKVHNDVFVVIDNTSWLSQFSNMARELQVMDIAYKLEITTIFAANDLYNKTFMFFMITFGVLFALIVLMMCLYRQQKGAHEQVLETKREIKRITLNKQAEQLRESLS